MAVRSYLLIVSVTAQGLLPPAAILVKQGSVCTVLDARRREGEGTASHPSHAPTLSLLPLFM